MNNGARNIILVVFGIIAAAVAIKFIWWIGTHLMGILIGVAIGYYLGRSRR